MGQSFRIPVLQNYWKLLHLFAQLQSLVGEKNPDLLTINYNPLCGLTGGQSQLFWITFSEAQMHSLYDTCNENNLAWNLPLVMYKMDLLLSQCKKVQIKYCKLIVLFTFKYLVLTSTSGFPCRKVVWKNKSNYKEQTFSSYNFL